MAKRVKQSAVRRHASGLTTRNADLSRSQPFRWAWHERVLLGYLNLQIGEEGVGKGNLTAWQAARITRGELPGDLKGSPARVAFVGDEDAWDHIWVPRLAAAGAALSGVAYIEAGTKGGGLDVRTDADALREYIEAEDVRFVYFDQLLDNLGIGTDHWKDKHVRDALAPLRAVAQTTDCAMLASMHPNKREGSFRDRVSGTPAFNALSRSSLLVAHHPDEDGRVVVVRAKGNYSAEPPAFEFRIQETPVTAGSGKRARTLTTSKIVDTRETGLRAEDVLGAKPRSKPDSERSLAKARLSELMAGVSRPAAEVLAQMEAEGFSRRTTQWARKELKIGAWQEGYQGPHYWGRKPPKKMKVKRGKAASSEQRAKSRGER